MDIAIYPGSFDPVTYGHTDVIERSLKIVPKLVVAVAQNPIKDAIFSVPERVEILKEVLGDQDGVEITSFGGLLIDYAREIGARVIIKGLRAISDFEYEFQMALMNRKLSPEVETLFMMTSEECLYLSSSMIKEITRLGGDISSFVPPTVVKRLREKLGK